MTTIERLLLDLLRTPADPDPPLGAADSLRVFRASRNYLTYRRLDWGLRQAAAIGAIAAYFVLDWLVGIPKIAEQVFGATPDRFWVSPDTFWGVVQALEIFALFVLLLQIPITFFLTQLDYHYRWYMTTDRSLRIREGIALVREQTMMLANVQNVAIRQGPLQRWLGISDVEVRSAGGGGGQQGGNEHMKPGRDLHLCYFRGVSNAEEIRDLILARLRRLRDAGLGDPDDKTSEVGGSTAVEAARLLLEEARATRRCLGAERVS
jgi:membrane protein YdbS with pleckstrin-like domain